MDAAPFFALILDPAAKMAVEEVCGRKFIIFAEFPNFPNSPNLRIFGAALQKGPFNEF